MCLCKGLPIPGGEIDSTSENWFPVSEPGICIFHRAPPKSNVSACLSSALIIFLDIDLFYTPKRRSVRVEGTLFIYHPPLFLSQHERYLNVRKFPFIELSIHR